MHCSSSAAASVRITRGTDRRLRSPSRGRQESRTGIVPTLRSSVFAVAGEAFAPRAPPTPGAEAILPRCSRNASRMPGVSIVPQERRRRRHERAEKCVRVGFLRRNTSPGLVQNWPVPSERPQQAPAHRHPRSRSAPGNTINGLRLLISANTEFAWARRRCVNSARPAACDPVKPTAAVADAALWRC